MKKIVIVSGLPDSGRGTVINWLMRNIPQVSVITFKSVINDILRNMGWNRIEDSKYRTLRTKVIDALEVYNNGLAPTIAGIVMARDTTNTIFILKLNRPKDINRIKKRFPKKKIVTVLVDREGCKSNSIPKAEILNYPYDVVFDNNGTVDELVAQIENFALTHLAAFYRHDKIIEPTIPNKY